MMQELPTEYLAELKREDPSYWTSPSADDGAEGKRC